MTAQVDRRALLKLLGAVALSSATPAAFSLQETATAEAVPGLPGIDVDAIRDLAEAYVAQGEDAQIVSMTERLRSTSLEDDALVAELLSEMKEDFVEDRIVLLHGWHVSRTEARVLAAASELLR